MIYYIFPQYILFSTIILSIVIQILNNRNNLNGLKTNKPEIAVLKYYL